MRKMFLSQLSKTFVVGLLITTTILSYSCKDKSNFIEDPSNEQGPDISGGGDPEVPNRDWPFTMKQTLSSGAQINTIAFSGLAFYSGSFYASTFYPPGKIADYFGFQFMRDNDLSESGHNTDFLTKAAWHTMNILNSQQIQKLIDLASEQEQLFNNYAIGRLLLIKAFHRYLDGDLPSGTTMLDIEKVKEVSANLYIIDGEISYRRAVVFAEVIKSLSLDQKKIFSTFSNTGMKEWTMPERPTVSIPKGLNTWVMSNASELFSWYLRDIQADIYFCPERQGTYFGGFYMKDAPAVGNPGYDIDSEATANKGSGMLQNILTKTQSDLIKEIYPAVTDALNNIFEIRTKIATELRKERVAAGTTNKTTIINLSKEYGEYDGVYNYEMVERFVKVGKTLDLEQKVALNKLRDLDNYPDKPGMVFIYSAETKEPAIESSDFLFK